MIGLAGVGVSILGIGAAYIFQFSRRALRQKEPSWAIYTNELIGDPPTLVAKSGMPGLSPPEIKMFFDGEYIPQLSVSRIAFWNHGYEPIYKTDISRMIPIRVVAPEKVRILRATILPPTTKPESQFTRTLDTATNIVNLSFEALAHNDGAVLDIIQSGTSTNAPKIEGDIMGVETIRRDVSRTGRWERFVRSKNLVLLMLFIMIVYSSSPTIFYSLLSLSFSGMKGPF